MSWRKPKLRKCKFVLNFCQHDDDATHLTHTPTAHQLPTSLTLLTHFLTSVTDGSTQKRKNTLRLHILRINLYRDYNKTNPKKSAEKRWTIWVNFFCNTSDDNANDDTVTTTTTIQAKNSKRAQATCFRKHRHINIRQQPTSLRTQNMRRLFLAIKKVSCNLFVPFRMQSQQQQS